MSQSKSIPWVVVQGIFLLISDWIVTDKIVIDLVCIFKLGSTDLLPGTLLNNLAPETILNGRVEEREVDTPHLIWGFGCVLLVPNSEQSLVCKIHWSVQESIAVAIESCALTKLIEYRGQLRLTNQVVEGSVI